MNGWLLDTNVVAEAARSACEPAVADWLARQDEDRLFISVLALAEFDKGLANLADDAPARRRIRASIGALEARFSGRILSLTDDIVRRWGRISGAVRHATGHSPPVIDTLLAASAIENDLYLATRNIKDVRDSGAALFDPWTDDPATFPLSGR